MVEARFLAPMTQRQESRIGNTSDFMIGRVSLGANCIIYTDYSGYFIIRLCNDTIIKQTLNYASDTIQISRAIQGKHTPHLLQNLLSFLLLSEHTGNVDPTQQMIANANGTGRNYGQCFGLRSCSTKVSRQLFTPSNVAPFPSIPFFPPREIK